MIDEPSMPRDAVLVPARWRDERTRRLVALLIDQLRNRRRWLMVSGRAGVATTSADPPPAANDNAPQ